MLLRYVRGLGVGVRTGGNKGSKLATLDRHLYTPPSLLHRSQTSERVNPVSRIQVCIDILHVFSLMILLML
jgi:hypothetical protein